MNIKDVPSQKAGLFDCEETELYDVTMEGDRNV